MVLSATDLRQMREAADTLLTETCEVLRTTMIDDGQGGVMPSGEAVISVMTWKEITAAPKCRVAPSVGGADRLAASKISNVQTWTITLPALTTVLTTDRRRVNGRTLDIAAIMGAHSDEVRRCVVCTESV